MGRFDLSDAEWVLIAPELPITAGKRGRPRGEDRRVLDAIFYILRTGAPWRDLPERYGPYTTAYNRFNRWARRGVWGSVFAALARGSPDSLRLIDSSIVRAHQHAAGARKKGGPRRSAARAAG
jgi:transposase